MSYNRSGSNSNYSSRGVASRGNVTKLQPSIKAPASLSDCTIIIKRMDDAHAQNIASTDIVKAKLAALLIQQAEIQKQIESFQSSQSLLQDEVKQYNVNKTFLLTCLGQLETREVQNIYVDRCKEFINQFTWVYPTIEDVTSVNPLPKDIFTFLKLQYQPLDCYTSEEIKSIAHYIHACNLLTEQRSEYDCILEFNTYSEIINETDEEYGNIGMLESCNGNKCSMYDDDSCCHKRYGWCPVKFEDINLDTANIVSHRRIN